jgi:hypothetical protein
MLDDFRRSVTEAGKLLGALKSWQDLATDLVSILQRCQSGSDLLPLLMPKVVVLDAGGEDEEVVRRMILGEMDQPRLRIHSHNLIQQHLDVSVLAEDRAQRRSNFVARE